jgi:hypothetical protein
LVDWLIHKYITHIHILLSLEKQPEDDFESLILTLRVNYLINAKKDARVNLVVFVIAFEPLVAKLSPSNILLTF